MGTTPIPARDRVELIEAVIELLMAQAAEADHRGGFEARKRLEAIYRAWDARYEDWLLARIEADMEPAS